MTPATLLNDEQMVFAFDGRKLEPRFKRFVILLKYLPKK
jgi:hypothetical protein